MTAAVDTDQVQSELHRFPEATNLPLIVYHGVLSAEGEEAAEGYEALFGRNGWGGGWRNGIFPYHHFHPNQHEVLGIAAGRATVRFGGPAGPLVEVRAGDVVVIPAGVSHCSEQASEDLLVVGAYPPGASAELRRGTPDLRQRAEVREVPLPPADPVFGRQGPLTRYWSQKITARPHDAPGPD